MKVKGMKIGLTASLMYTREQRFEFDQETTVIFDTEDTAEDREEAVRSLISEELIPRIKQTIKTYAKKDKSFRLALQLERPKLIQRMEHLLEAEKE